MRVSPAVAGGAGSAVRALALAVPGLAGAGAVAYGAWLAWPPAGWMTGGAIVLADVVWSRARSVERPGESR